MFLKPYYYYYYIMLSRFVLRSYGIDGLQKYIRHHCSLAKRFEQHVLKDSRFEICNEVKVIQYHYHSVFCHFLIKLINIRNFYVIKMFIPY